MVGNATPPPLSLPLLGIMKANKWAEGGSINCKSFSLIPRLAQYCRFSLLAKFNFAIICNLGQYCFYFNIVQKHSLHTHTHTYILKSQHNITWPHALSICLSVCFECVRACCCLPLSAVECPLWPKRPQFLLLTHLTQSLSLSLSRSVSLPLCLCLSHTHISDTLALSNSIVHCWLPLCFAFAPAIDLID